QAHVENMKKYGVPVVVAINRFTHDTDKEVELVRKLAKEAGADEVALSEVWAKGGEGGKELAEAVVRAADQPSDFKFLYKDEDSIKEKIEKIAVGMYGADGVDYSPAAEKKVEMYTKMGLSNLPICMAKTHLSLSHDPTLKGRPTGFRIPVRDIKASVGAGFLFPICGDMRTMPGLPAKPAGQNIDIDENGVVTGLF
ncbi:MAG: formate--tetrahydrofolate ligase, partial [Actinomycetia bacterium]|nr:formate--tetrahydrofolate ligase [Actinomycetes bacterium]